MAVHNIIALTSIAYGTVERDPLVPDPRGYSVGGDEARPAADPSAELRALARGDITYDDLGRVAVVSLAKERSLKGNLATAVLIEDFRILDGEGCVDPEHYLKASRARALAEHRNKLSGLALVVLLFVALVIVASSRAGEGHD